MKPILAVCCCILLSACSTLPRAVTRTEASRPASSTATFYVLSHGWHTGLVVCTADINPLLPDLAKRFPDKRYYEIGWGDSGFYQAQKVTTGLAMRAMFASPGTVVHVVAFDQEPATFFPRSKSLVVRTRGDNYERMLEYLRSSFLTDLESHVISRGPGLYGDSQFYEAVGRYHLLNTCNKWTAKALYSAGVDISPSITLRSAGVMNAVEEDIKR